MNETVEAIPALNLGIAFIPVALIIKSHHGGVSGSFYSADKRNAGFGPDIFTGHDDRPDSIRCITSDCRVISNLGDVHDFWRRRAINRNVFEAG